MFSNYVLVYILLLAGFVLFVVIIKWQSAKRKRRKDPVLWYAKLDVRRQQVIMIPPEIYLDEVNYLLQNGYDLTTLKEVVDFVEGRKKLPVKSIVMATEDLDASRRLKYVMPALLKYNQDIFFFMPVDSSGYPGEDFFRQ